MQSNITKYSLFSILLLFCSLVFSSCLDSTNSSTQYEDLLETAKNVAYGPDEDPVLTTYVDLLEQTSLDSTVANEGPFTAIIPVDSAFSALPSGVSLPGGDLDSLTGQQIASITQYHLIEGIVNLGQLNAEENIESVQGEDLLFEISSNPSTNSNQVFVNDGQLIGSVQASNGIIYIIDTVLFPDAYLNTFGQISKRYELNTLEEAIRDVNLANTLEDESASYTVFAPSDEALENTELSGDDIQYHVLTEEVSSNNISGTYTTLSGDQVTIEVSGNTITYNGEEATITEENIEGTNGVVHIIDAAFPPSSE